MAKIEYDYPRPAVTVDFFVFDIFTDSFLAIRRGNDPFKGCLALPGGFMEIDETLTEAALRELKEETGLSVEDLDEFSYSHTAIMDGVKRDPRSRVLSVLFSSFCMPSAVEKAKADDDAAELLWIPRYEFRELKYAFDHYDAIYYGLENLGRLP